MPRAEKKGCVKVYIGIDNGVTGSIGIITTSDNQKTGTSFFPQITFSEQDYTKKKKNITRINFLALSKALWKYVAKADEVYIMMERPMVNPTRFTPSTSALRAMEACLNTILFLQKKKGQIFGFRWVDSKEWQRKFLTSGIKGPAELKKNSLQLGKKRYPKWAGAIDKQKDADGLFIAEFCRSEFE